MREPDIVVNSEITEAERASILARYINRDTLDSPWSPMARNIVGKGPATLTDAEWIDAHTWQRMPDGSLALVRNLR